MFGRKTIGCSMAAMIALLVVPSISAKNTKEAPAAPVPPQISSAKKILIANAGQDDLGASAGGTVLSGPPTRCYDEFYAAVKEWNRFEIVPTPASADLVLEIRCAFTDVERPLDDSSKPSTDLGRLSLTVVDRETHFVVWGFQEHVRNAVLQSNRDKNFEQAMTDIVNDLKGLEGSRTTGAPAAGKSAN
jgi:hypothetical protein